MTTKRTRAARVKPASRGPRRAKSFYARAADVIRKHGWCQGEYHKKGDGYCILGAIAKAHGVADDALTEWYDWTWNTSALSKVLGQDYENEEHIWNDEPGRTKKEVIVVLMRADKLMAPTAVGKRRAK